MVTFIQLNTTDNKKLVLDKKGEYVVFFHNLSGSYTFEIAASHIHLDIFGIYDGKKEDEFAIETIQHHTAPSSTSNLLIKGVFNDHSKLYYKGLIRLEKTAQKSHAYQKNQNLILSDFAFVESKPYLEILANDVFCTHGSTTGKLNEEDMFYLQTRGIKRHRSQQLMVNGFINEVVYKVKEKVPFFQYA